MNQATYGIDVYQLYEAHEFDLGAKALMDRDIRVTWRAHGWLPPSEQKKEPAKEAV